MRKVTIHLDYMDSLLTLKMSWQNFTRSFENTLFLVFTAKKKTLMIKTKPRDAQKHISCSLMENFKSCWFQRQKSCNIPLPQ